ncbi:hypothetical protein EVAR_48580_1 [Eumeta japonica]|uniref:Uncharacterized protein n=1 Tax=Eumeta variegata TaxID=151549 RepID=A0A4C1XB35_EUMVA|nr:hypothetical protein EVAR_48580_1 [Eumeta japonica]
MDVALNERTLTVKMVKSVGSCDQLEEVVKTYIELMRQACNIAIPLKSSKRGLKPFLVKSRVKGANAECAYQKAAHPKCGPQQTVNGKGLWDNIYSVIRETERKQENVLLQTDSKQVLGSDESATLLGKHFFLTTGSILTICIMNKLKDKPTVVVNYRQIRGICPGWTHLLPGSRSYEDTRVEDLNSQTFDRLAVIGLHIYTDGSRIEGKVGAALTEWRDGEETWYSTLRLDSFCTVFQAKIIVLQRAIQRAKKGKNR